MFRGLLIKIENNEYEFDDVKFSNSFLAMIEKIKNKEIILRKKIEYIFLLKLINKYVDSSIEELNFKTNKYGKPYLDFIEVGISNTSDLVFVAICNNPVGVDIERISYDKKINSDLENALLKNSSNKSRDELIINWTKYESYIKRKGSFISLEKIKTLELDGYFYQDIIYSNNMKYSLCISLDGKDDDFIIEKI